MPLTVASVAVCITLLHARGRPSSPLARRRRRRAFGASADASLGVTTSAPASVPERATPRRSCCCCREWTRRRPTR